MSLQMSIFDFMYERPKPHKNIRLIELFAGIGAQYKALKEITKGTDYKVESYKICEWAVPSIKAYNSIHIKDFNDYSKDKSIEEIKEIVKKVSLNYNEPINEKSNKLKDESWLRDVYNNIVATHNLINIMEVKGSDLEIVDTDKYTYVMTYSFPCQDLSKAGTRQGLEVSQKDGGTRSGLLWEVERILTELDYEHRPQCLLLENVPDLIEKNFIKSWHKWLEKLEEFGYSNYCEVLNAKDYGIPQNRKRFFCISIKGQHSYSFPNKLELKYRLKDLLEKDVDDKYFLSQKFLDYVTHNSSEKYNRAERFEQSLKHANEKGIAVALTTRQARGPLDNYIETEKIINVGNIGNGHHSKDVSSEEGLMPTLTTGNHSNGQVIATYKNKALDETLEKNKVEDGDFIDAYNRDVKKDVAGTITTGVSSRNNTFIAIKNDTKKGFIEAEQGDGVDISKRMVHHRGTVQKGLSQTLTCAGGENVGVVVNEKE